MRLSVLPPGVLGACLLLSACGGPSAAEKAFPLPATSAFQPGTCDVIAPDVVALGRAARRLGKGPTVPKPVEDDLTAAQKSLQAVAETAEPSVKPLLDAVVTRAGLVRVGIDVGRYSPDIGAPLGESYRALVRSCTGTGPASPTATTG